MYQMIMIPLDGSRHAEAALPLAIAIARHTAAAIHLLTVVERDPAKAPEPGNGSAVGQAETYLANVEARLHGQGIRTVTRGVAEGHAVEVLNAMAAALRIDLVVMATHGRGTLSRLRLGSVADAFTRQADRPVLVVRPPEPTSAQDALDFAARTILVPLDGSALSEAALTHAIAFGDAFDATYHLTQVVPWPSYVPQALPLATYVDPSVRQDGRRAAAAYLERHATRMRNCGWSVTTSVAVDIQAARGVLSEAVAVGSDVVVMATHGRSGLARALLGSTTTEVLRGARGPLLLFRPVGLPD